MAACDDALPAEFRATVTSPLQATRRSGPGLNRFGRVSCPSIDMILADAHTEGWPDKTAWVEQFSMFRKFDRQSMTLRSMHSGSGPSNASRVPCTHLERSPGPPARGSDPQPLSNESYGLLDVGASALRFRAPSNLFQRWNESPITPFKQLREGLDVRRASMEVVALIGVLIRQADDIEQVLSNLFRVRRGLPLFASALPRWASGAVDVYRPNRDGVSVWPVARVICTIGVERVRDVQIANLAMARNFPVEVSTAPAVLQETD